MIINDATVQLDEGLEVLIIILRIYVIMIVTLFWYALCAEPGQGETDRGLNGFSRLGTSI